MKLVCPYYNQGICRSCTLLEVDYTDQLKQKEKTLSELLGISPSSLLPTISSKLEGFRSKAKFVVTGSQENPLIGLAGVDDLDSGREILSCPLHNPQINSVLPVLKRFISQAKLTPYEIGSKRGELKGLILFTSSTSEMYLRFILRSKESLDRIRKNLPWLQESIKDLNVISVNIQPVPHAILEGEEEIFLTSQESVGHSIGEIKSAIHPQGFVQTNEDVSKMLYKTAAKWIEEISPSKFCELFSGQGAFSFAAVRSFKEGLGVEINASAVARANQTARDSGLEHLKFIASDAAKVEKIVSDFKPEVLLVNPPRRGLGEAIEIVKQIAVKEFLYSSCSAESLAKDLESLKDHYQIKRVQIFDMFPHTKHFETLVWLQTI